MSTMCTDPGFIPFHYRYNTDSLTKPFRVIQEGDMTGKELKQYGLGVVDIERRNLADEYIEPDSKDQKDPKSLRLNKA